MSVTEVRGGYDDILAALQTLATGNKVVYSVVEPKSGHYIIYHDT